jgi:hypothetical protein
MDTVHDPDCPYHCEEPNHQWWPKYVFLLNELCCCSQQLTESRLRAVILVQAENEFSESSTRNPYMQAIIDLYRSEGIVIRKFLSFPIAYRLY